MSKYDKLDAAIITYIAGDGGRGGSPFNSSRVNTLADTFAKPYQGGCRVIDRRLQALRKAGRIKYGGQKVGWLVVEAKESA